jgi:hypothetical protein
VSLLCLLNNCGEKSPYSAKNQEISPYVEAFNRRALAHDTPIPGNFSLSYDFAPGSDSDFQKSSLAYCQPGHNWGHIKVNQDYWTHSAQESEKHMIIAHELTHCYFRLGHFDNKLHIMNSELPHHFEYKEELWTELFESINSEIINGLNKSPIFFDPLSIK